MDKFHELYNEYVSGRISSITVLQEFSRQRLLEMSLPQRFKLEFDKVSEDRDGVSVKNGEVALAGLIKDMRREYLNRMAIVEVTPDEYSFIDFVNETLQSRTYKNFSEREKIYFWALVDFVSERL